VLSPLYKGWTPENTVLLYYVKRRAKEIKNVQLITHADARAFLHASQTDLERHEVEHSLILGVALELQGDPASSETVPYFATVRDAVGLVAAAVMIPPHPLVLASNRSDCNAALAAIAHDLQRSKRQVSAVVAPRLVADRFAEIWSHASGCPARLAMEQRLHALTKLRSISYPPGRLRLGTEADLDLVSRWIAAFNEEALGEHTGEQERSLAQRRIAAREVYLWEDVEPRAMAARARPTRLSIALNAVYTPSELRRQGFATACVASLSGRLLDEGFAFCVLFTDLANPTSNSIYARIGYQPVGDFALYQFETELPASPTS
jgi:predicted GNAT family acetyltransferase